MWKKISIISLFTAAALLVTKRYFAGVKCRCKGKLYTKAVVITGATSGIGKALAFEVAKTGAQVVLACRDLETANKVCKEIISTTGNEFIYYLPLDLSSIKSIHEFSRLIHRCEYEIHALVNNAAVFYLPQQDTGDGFDVTFQANYLGTFILTLLLLDLLVKGGPESRIVNVSSSAHRFLSVPPTFLTNENIIPSSAYTKNFNLFNLYCQTKLCVNLFTNKLAQKLKGTGVRVVSVDPGNVETHISRNIPLVNSPIFYALQWPLKVLLIKTPLQGAQTVLHAVLSENLITGSYLRECSVHAPSKLSLDDNLAEALWKQSLKWSNLIETDVKVTI